MNREISKDHLNSTYILG